MLEVDMEAIIAGLVCIGITALIMGVFYVIKREKIQIMERIDSFVCDPVPDYLHPELNQPLSERVFKPMVGSMTKFFKKFIPQEKKLAYENKLMLAGNPHGITSEGFAVLKYVVLILSIVIGALFKNPFAFCIVVLVGLFMPDLYIKSNQDKRREAILKSLPDTLDLLCVSVEAGLGFDAALQKVIDKTSGPLADEFEKTMQEINVGKPRREALRDMVTRVGVDDVTTFLGSIIQADQLGVSISNVLRVQSQQVRANRRMHAQEKAQKAPIKILIPLVFFIFPTIMVVLLGPAIIQLMDSFK
jgi:tight adherence protein C